MIETQTGNFEFYRGDTYVRHIIISWSRPIDQIYFTVKNDSNEKHPLIKKKIGDGIYLVDKNDNESTYMITISSEDTDNLAVGSYNFDFEVVSGNIRLTPMVGTITLSEDYTRRRDEY